MRSFPLFPVCLAFGALLSGCVREVTFDLMFRNGTSDVLYLAAWEGSGVIVDVEAQAGDDWVPIVPSLGLLCAPRCGGPGVIECVEPVADLPVVHALWPVQGVMRQLSGEWWYLDEDAGCARPAPMEGDLRAWICWDNEALDATTGEPLPEPRDSGVLGRAGGAELPEPVCAVLPFDLRQARAKSFVFPNEAVPAR